MRCQIKIKLLYIYTSIHNQSQPQCISNIHCMVKQNYYNQIQLEQYSHMSYNNPRCPNGILTKSVCVTQKCNSSPYLCDSNRMCACYNAHRYCKTMQWASVLTLLNNYQQTLPQQLKLYLHRIRKIYNNIITKVNTQITHFHQYVEQKLYGSQYAKIMHYINKQDYNSITCQNLGTIITIMTDRVYSKNTTQEGNTSLQRFTVNQMKALDRSISTLMLSVEGLYKDKYRIIQKQLRQLNKNKKTHSSVNISKSQTSISNNTNLGNTYKNSISQQQFNDIEMTQSLILKRSQSTNKNNTPSKTFSSNFYNTGGTEKFKITDFTSTKDTQLLSPQSPLKKDLTYPKTINSKIVTNASILNHLIMNKVKQYRLIYRASDNDYSIKEFYRKMANHTFFNQKNKLNTQTEDANSMTLLIARTQFGKIVGGFTKLKWARQSAQEDQQDNSHKSSNYRQDIRGTSMMFSADLNQRYQLLQPNYAIYCGSKSIGFGKNDIRIAHHSQKSSKNYIGFPSSYNNGLYLPIKKSSLTLSGSHDSVHFKINQWEMFEVVLAGQKRSDSIIKNNNSSLQLTKSKLIEKLKQR